MIFIETLPQKLTVERIPLTPPEIPPLPTDIVRPLWSVMIPTYNCSEYLKIALQSVLVQDPGVDLMQIEVIDDCSTDADVEQIVQEIGKGRVLYYRQNCNVGSLRNFETCLNRAHGHYIHLLHGDDRVKNGFYKTMSGLFEIHPEAGAAFCAFDLIKGDNSYAGTSNKEASEPGILQNWLFRLAEQPRLQYVCMVVKRSVYENLGSFCIASYGEDWEMWVRIAKHYPTAYTPEALGEYRVHQASITSQSFLSGNNVRDIVRIIDKIADHVPLQEKQKVRKKARKFYADYAIDKSYSLWYRSRNKEAVNMQMREALNLYKNSYLIFQVLLIKLLMLLPQTWLPAVRKIIRRSS